MISSEQKKSMSSSPKVEILINVTIISATILFIFIVLVSFIIIVVSFVIIVVSFIVLITALYSINVFL